MPFRCGGERDGGRVKRRSRNRMTWRRRGRAILARSGALVRTPRAGAGHPRGDTGGRRRPVSAPTLAKGRRRVSPPGRPHGLDTGAPFPGRGGAVRTLPDVGRAGLATLAGRSGAVVRNPGAGPGAGAGRIVSFRAVFDAGRRGA